MSSLHILFVEDQAYDAELCEHELRQAGLSFSSSRVWTSGAFLAALSARMPDLILSDFSMPTDLDGFEALRLAREKAGQVPFVFVSGTIGEERAVAAMKAGATDYVLKDRLERLAPVVVRALAEARDRRTIADAQSALQASEATFRSFMQHLPGRAAIRDLNGRYTYINAQWQDAPGRPPPEAVLGRTAAEVLDPALAERVEKTDRRVVAQNAPVRQVVRLAEGADVKWWLAHHFPIPDARGAVSLVGTIAIDVTEQKLQEEKLARIGRMHAVLSGTNAAIVRNTDGRRLLADACRIAVEQGRFAGAWVGLYDRAGGVMTPVASAGLGVGGTGPGALAADGAPEAGGMLARMLEDGGPVVCNSVESFPLPPQRRADALARGIRSVVVMPLRAGDEVIGALTLFATEPDAFGDDELRLLMQLAHDVSFALAYIDKEEKLAWLAWHDPLTGLGNRALLQERLTEAIAAARRDATRAAVLVWDVKRFSSINDSLGREAGDALLCGLARRLEQLWPEVTHTARLSADKFAGLIPEGANAARIAYLLERSSAAIAEPYTIAGTEVTADLTVGVAFSPEDSEDAEAALANGEAALKHAKARGEPYLFYEPAMNARVGERLSLEGRLRRALERDQFVLHYEPKVDLGTGRVRGLEALIRWNDPEVGLVSPQTFVPLLEETGLILDVGRWAIASAIEHWKALAARGRGTQRIAVNVSALQLHRRDFVDMVEKALERCPDGRHGLDLEITESLLMRDIEANTRKLEALKAMGVNIAIDDFGTGYSSLSYLARLPADALKIDAEFIRTMTGKPQSMTIVSTIISLAHTLNMAVIAEGVETSEQANLLRELRCDQAQGYFFSRPEEPAAVPRP